MSHQALIIDTARTPRGRGKKGRGALTDTHPQVLLSQTLDTLAKRTGIEKKDVEDVIGGCVTQVDEQGADITRFSVLMGDWPLETSGVTLNRFCGSGLQAVNFAAMGIMSGQQDMTIGAGVESMSRVPMGSDKAKMSQQIQAKHPTVPQGISADLIATIEGFSRKDVDEFALSSQKKAEVAQKENRFSKSLFAVKHPDTGEVLLEQDEFPRHGSTFEALNGLKAAFQEMGAMPLGNGKSFDQLAKDKYPEVKEMNHVHTAGNSSGIVDGAGAVLLASDDYAKAHGLKGRARIRSIAVYGDEPLIMLTAPTPASKRALKRAGMEVSDIDLWEINEAFAVVPLQTMRKLKIDPDKVNVNGGSIALGHPIGATGAMLVGTALDELERRDLNTALITLCTGGGMAVATIIERV